MDVNDVKPKLEIRTVFELSSTKGMTINDKNLSQRKPDTDGVVLGYVPGHGGDVWWVRHEGDDIPAAYTFEEFNPR